MRAVIAEDDTLMREGIAGVLAGADFDVVAAVGTADELLDAVAAADLDIAVVDVRLPPTQTDEGARAARRIREEHPRVGVLILSQIVEAAHARRLFAESPHGFGYLLKQRVIDVDGFVESVRRVAAGGSAIDPEVVSQLMGGRPADDPLRELSRREREVLASMAEGLSNEGICGRLYLSHKTVEAHVTRIFSKLGLPAATADDHRRVRAVLRYLEATAHSGQAERDR